MNLGFEIRQSLTEYVTRSYVIEAFLCKRMFNPLTTFSFNQVKIPRIDTLIMSLLVIFKRPSDQQFDGHILKQEYRLITDSPLQINHNFHNIIALFVDKFICFGILLKLEVLCY